MPKAKPSKSYQQLNQELSEIIAWFESGDAQVDEALTKYQKATGLITEIKAYLNSTENTLKKINAKLE